jgi:hypothetical protein
MRRVIRANAPAASMAAIGSAVIAWLGLYGFAWNDYDNEVRPAIDALQAGHVERFLALLPAYGGSIIERAPFALLANLWGGGALAAYRMLALPCLLLVAALGLWLVRVARANGRPRLDRAVVLGLCVANPITLRALELGHPEELFGGALCVFAIVLATRARALGAGLLLGLAIANKEWALLALGPVLLALPPGRRLRCLGVAALIVAAVLAPLMLANSGGFIATTRGVAAPPSGIFQPWQLWWFLGHHGTLVHGLYGAPKPGYRIGPAWTSLLSHPLILAFGALLPATLWVAGRRRLGEGDALLALALLLLARCVLDAWDTVYYPLPFLLALLAWEATRARARPPLLSLTCTVAVWLSFEWLPKHVSPDAQAAFFLAWSLPLAGTLALRLRRATRATSAASPRSPRAEPAQETTVSSLARLVRAS